MELCKSYLRDGTLEVGGDKGQITFFFIGGGKSSFLGAGRGREKSIGNG